MVYVDLNFPAGKKSFTIGFDTKEKTRKKETNCCEEEKEKLIEEKNRKD